MRNIISRFVIFFFCLTNISFSQTKNIEKGTYITTNKGSKIKLNLLDKNQYEFILYSGEYEIKGDSILFKSKEKNTDVFEVTYSKDKSAKSKKIKVKFINPYYSFYVGTQNGANNIVYQKINSDYNAEQAEVELEIDQSEFLYLVYTDYDESANISKYALPKNINNITVKYSPDIMGDFNVSGYFDSKTNQLTLGEKAGKNPLTFIPEKNSDSSVQVPLILPLESQKIPNWTYPGKEALVIEDFGEVVVDSAAAVVEAYPSSPFNFKFKIEDNLKSAISSTKNKFLIVYADTKNKTAKDQFDSFVKDQEVDISYSMYEGYNPKFDLYNYYLASKNDKNWFKTNKINEEPVIVILNENGEILATAKSTLLDKKIQLSYYDDFQKRLMRVNAIHRFNEVIKNKKVNDSDLILAFNTAATVYLPYDYDDTNVESNPSDFKLKKVNLDKKEILQTWSKLITSHQKDKNPNMSLVETIVKEITNKGFYKLIFDEAKLLNDTDFMSIDYLIKHYDAINQERLQFNAKDETHYIGDIGSEIAVALDLNSSGLEDNFSSGKVNQAKVVSVYKKLIATGKGGFNVYKNYFAFLSSEAEKKGSDIEYIKEFDTYFDKYLVVENENPIQRLDEIYATLDPNSDYSYNGWNYFKSYHSDLSNNIAWSVVLKPENSNYLNKAIIWSEYSLMVSKNNPYYLDTLAQLYYKDGQKEKAIATQQKALQFSSAVFEEETLNDMKEVLTKMQNGTY